MTGVSVTEIALALDIESEMTGVSVSKMVLD